MEECTAVLNKLITIVTSNLVLHRPNHSKQFELEVNASQYTIGAILYQRNDSGHQRPVTYHSETLNDAETGYNIHNWELLAIIRGLENWRHLLLGTSHKVLVFTDHANLQYYHQPHKINCHVAHYIPHLAEYSYKLIHKPGKYNKADHLSHCLDYNQGKDDNQDLLVLPDSVFARATSLSSLEQHVFDAQL
jgi:RNase H-like domain found in reverse transcriptase